MKLKLLLSIFFLVHHLFSCQLNAQRYCIDCSPDSVKSLYLNAHSPKDTLYAIIATIDNKADNLNGDELIVLVNKLVQLNSRLKLEDTKPYELFREAMLLWNNDKFGSIELMKKSITAFDKQRRIMGVNSLFCTVRRFYSLAVLEKERFEYYQEKLHYYQEHGPVENMAVCYHAIARYYVIKADYNNAISHYLRSADLFKPFSLIGYSNELCVAGFVYTLWGNYERAEYYLKLGYGLSIKAYMWELAVYTKVSLALLEKKKKNFKEALNNIVEALGIYQQHSDEIYSAYKPICISEKGGILLDMNKPASAFKLLKEALVIADSIDLPMFSNAGDFMCEFYIYQYYHSTGKDTIAEKQLLSAFYKAYKFKNDGAIMKFGKELAIFYNETNKPLNAIHYALNYIKLSDSIREMQNSYNIAQYETDQKDLIAYKELQRQKILRNSFIVGFTVILIFASVFFTQRIKIKKGKKKSDELLLNILPYDVAEELKAKGSAEAQLIDDVTVLFTDFKGFTSMSEKLSPKELVRDIHECFSAFDLIMEKNGMEKIKTIGDSYMAAGGLPTPNDTHASDAVKAALEIRQFIEEGKARKIAMGVPYFEIRIGIHTGPVVAGIVGVKKFAYDIWGDTVNTASRMESSGEAGKVNISGSTYEIVKDQFTCIYRGKIEAKSKGMIDMYFVERI